MSSLDLNENDAEGSEAAPRLSRAAGIVRAIVGRVLVLALIALAVALATFALVRLIPGDPAQVVAGSLATEQDLANIRARLGLDGSVLEQLGTYLNNLAHLDLGTSFVTQEPVTAVIAQRLPKTLALAGTVLFLVFAVSLPLGIAVAAATFGGRRRSFDVAFSALTGIAGSLPSYLAGTVLAYIFAVRLGWLPVAGSDRWQSIILPAFSVALVPIAAMSRIVKVQTAAVLQQEYITMARSKRLSLAVLYGRHVMLNVLGSALAFGGILIASLLGGTVVVENVFAWPGLGTALVQSVLNNDYPVVQGIALVLALVVVLVNAVIDVVLRAVDPRKRVA